METKTSYSCPVSSCGQMTLPEWICYLNEKPGITGPPGPTGITGPAGAQGPVGPEGPGGVQGPPGPQGAKGDQGPQGIQGIQGAKGDAGAVGPQGPAGLKGDQGVQGPAGPAGAQGPIGLQGPAGPKGDQGAIGPAGPAGSQGNPGPVGPAGPKGDQGAIGPAGAQGAQGPAGPAGPIGPQGNPGLAGPAGPQGEVGPQGAQGPQGVQGLKGDQGARGPQGAQGIQGATGEAGPSSLEHAFIHGTEFSGAIAPTNVVGRGKPIRFQLIENNTSNLVSFTDDKTAFTINRVGTYQVIYNVTARSTNLANFCTVGLYAPSYGYVIVGSNSNNGSLNQNQTGIGYIQHTDVTAKFQIINNGAADIIVGGTPIEELWSNTLNAGTACDISILYVGPPTGMAIPRVIPFGVCSFEEC